MRKKANGEYYKASGIFSGFDLLALFLAEFIATSVLSLLYVALWCYLEKGIGKVFSFFILPLLTAWLIGWLGMVLVKHFKMRAPGMVFGAALLAAILGSLCAWGVVWGLAQSGLGFIQFVSTANQTMKSAGDQYFVWGLLVGCCLMMSFLPFIQAGRPFSETSGRWFKRKGLRPFKIYFSHYEEFSEAICGHRDFFNFFNGYGYGITSDVNFIINFTLSVRICKIWLYYDKDVDTCYLTMLERESRVIGGPLLRNKAITRVQAKLLHQKLA